MKLHLPKKLFTAVLAAVCATATTYAADDTDRVLHVYLLTGQSNSLGTVRVDPAPQELRDRYATTQDEAMLWNGNMNKNNGALHEPEATRVWKPVVPQAPNFNGNLCMGPEYGFAYMMEKKGWNTATESGTDHDIAIIKSSLDGGGNGYWLKGTAAYNTIVSSVTTALGQLPQGTKIDISGLMYLQGESDSAAEIPLAKERYLAFLDNLKTDLAAAGYDASKILADSVVGEPANWHGGDTQTDSGATSAKEFLALAQENENVGYVYTRDMTKITGGDTLGVHYDGKSQLTIGARYAYAMAIQQGMNVAAEGRVRSQQYGDAQLGETAVSLNEARAWWSNDSSWTPAALANEVAVWDLSSANTEDTLSGDLAVKGIRVEDPFRSTVVIKNAGGANATLSVGAAGIELQRSDLNVQTKLATTADQTWALADKRTLSISGAVSGNHTLSLQNSTGSGTANVVLGAADTAHSWVLNDGTQLAGTQLGNVQVAAGATAGLAADDVAAVQTGAGTTLNVGGAGEVSAMSIGSLTLGGNAVFGMDFKSTTSYDTLTIGSIAGTGSVVFDFAVGKTGKGGTFTVVSGWNNAYGFSATGLGEGSSLAYDGGNLVLTLAGGGNTPDYSKAWPTETPTQVALTPTGAFDASAHGSNTYATGTAQYFFGVGHTQGTAETPVNNYAEIHNAGATWVSAVGSTSGGNTITMVGDSSVKVTGNAVTSGTTVYNAVNANVTGNVYMELDNPNATYAAINGAYNADISGSNTTVIKGGTVTGNVTMGSVNGGKTIGGGTYLQIEGGTFNGMVTGGNNAGGSVIRGDVHVSIEGGTFKDYVIAGGFAGKVEGDVYLNISGGDFSAMNGTKGIWAGTGSAYGSITGNTTVTIQDVAEGNAFADYTGVLNGGNQSGNSALASRALILSGVTTGIKANLQNFTSLEVTDESDATLTYAQVNAWLHDTTLKVNGNSSFTLDSQGNRWTPANLALNVEEGSTFTKTGNLWVNLGAVTGDGTVEVTGGGLLLADVSGFNGTARVADGKNMQVTTPGAGVTYELGNGANLVLSNPSAASMGTLSGKGTAAINGTIAAGASGTRFGFADDWTGTVKLTKDNIGTSGNQQLFLANLGHKGSVIEIDGVGKDRSNYVFLGTGDANAVNADVKLTGDGLTLNAGSSGSFAVFNGAWSGSGAFNFTFGAATQGFRFNGDMTGYSGNITLAGAQVLEFGNGGIGASVGSISGTGTIIGTGNAATLRFNYSGDVNAMNLITGNVKVEQNGTASLTLTSANTYTGTTTVNNGALILKDAGALGTGTVTLKQGDGRYIGFGDAAVLTADGANATIANHASVTAAGISGTEERHAVISNATLTVTGDFTLTHTDLNNSTLDMQQSGDTTLDTKLTNADVINNGSGTLTLTHAENSVHNIQAETGDICFLNSESLSVTDLTIADNLSVSVYQGGTPAAGAGDANVGHVAVKKLLSAGSGTTLEGNLALLSGAVVDVTAEGLNLGCSLTLNAGLTLAEQGVNMDWDALAAATSSNPYLLVTGADSFSLLGGGENYSDCTLTMGDHVDAATYFTNLEQGRYYMVATQVNGAWNIGIVPEPATATLSLLALATLALRRRRSK